jgi:shikimate kinase
VDEIAEVLAERLPLYELAAHHAVQTSNRSVEQVVDEIIRVIPVEAR